MPFMLAITNGQLAVLIEAVRHMISCTYVIFSEELGYTCAEIATRVVSVVMMVS